jgi:hypothetical protein
LAKVLGLAGLGVYLAGPPILHGVRGNATNVESSLGYRVGLPLAGFTAGFVIGCVAGGVASSRSSGSEWRFSSLAYAYAFGIFGAGVGVLAAMVVDATVIAREPVTRTTAWGVIPSLDPRSRSIGLTAVGRF